MKQIIKKFRNPKVLVVTIALIISAVGGAYLNINSSQFNPEGASANAEWCPASQSSCTSSADLRFRGYDYYYADQYGGGGGWSGYSTGGYETIETGDCPGGTIKFQGGRRVCETGVDMQLDRNNVQNCRYYGLTPEQLNKCQRGEVFSRDVDLGAVVDPYTSEMGSFGFHGIPIEERGYYDNTSPGEDEQQQNESNYLAGEVTEQSLGCVSFQYPEYIAAGADLIEVALYSDCENTPKKLNLWIDGTSVGKCKNQDSCGGVVGLPSVKRAGQSYEVRAVYNYGLLGLGKKEIAVSVPVK